MDIELHQCNCANCHVAFWMSLAMVKQLRECHNEFYCPNGHSNYYPAKTDAEKYKELYEKEQSRRIEAEERAKQQTIAALRKVRSRPHAKRTS